MIQRYKVNQKVESGQVYRVNVDTVAIALQGISKNSVGIFYFMSYYGYVFTTLNGHGLTDDEWVIQFMNMRDKIHELPLLDGILKKS